MAEAISSSSRRAAPTRCRGTAYYYHQNDKLIANDFFFNRAGVENPLLRRHEAGGTAGGPIIRNRTFFFGSYQRTRARTSFVDEASNTVRMPRDLTDDRSDAGINRFAAAIWNPESGPVDLSAINPISRSLLKATFPDGTFLVPSGANGINCELVEDQVAESCQVVSVIPATFHQDQFTANIDHQLATTNRLAGKFFYSDQPSRDPLFDSNALTRHEVEETTRQQTFSLTDTHVFGSNRVNEFRAGFFRNRNNTVPVVYFTNAEFGIQNPFAPGVPDLTQIAIDANDVGSPFSSGRLATAPASSIARPRSRSGTRSRSHGEAILSAWAASSGGIISTAICRKRGTAGTTSTTGTTSSPWATGPCRRRSRAQICDTALNYGETVRGYRMTDWSWFVADDWKVSLEADVEPRRSTRLFRFSFREERAVHGLRLSGGAASGRLQDGFIFPSNFDSASVPRRRRVGPADRR